MSADNYFCHSITREQIENDNNLILEDEGGYEVLKTTEKDSIGTIPSFNEYGYLYYGMKGASGGDLARYLYKKYKVLWHEDDAMQFIANANWELVPKEEIGNVIYQLCFDDMVAYHIIEESEIDYSLYDQKAAQYYISKIEEYFKAEREKNEKEREKKREENIENYEDDIPF